MNKVCAGLLCFLLPGFLQAQDVCEGAHPSVIEPYELAVSDKKTTNLIFPYAVRRAHCAAREVDIHQMKDVKNILLVRAIASGFSPTNLSVVTSDGRFYSFSLQYASEPSAINIRFGDSCLAKPEPLADVGYNEAMLDSSAALVAKQKKVIRRVARNQQVKLSLDGIFMHNNLLWFAMTVTNASLIGYPIDYLKVFVRDRTRSKKTIRQEKEVQPLFIKMGNNTAAGNASRIIIAFEPFTIPVDKILAIQMAEKSGGRSIELRAMHYVFYKARHLR